MLVRSASLLALVAAVFVSLTCASRHSQPTSAATARDINGDGFDDVVVGGGGTMYVYYGSAAGLAATPTTIDAPSGALAFGSRLAIVGDIDRDGFADVAVGSPEVGAGYPSTVWVYFGASGGITATPTMIASPLEGATFGLSLAGADTNGDGFADLIVGGAYEAAFVYLGSADGIGVMPATTITPAGGNVDLVARAGDVNGDGFDDVLVVGTAPYLYLGSASGVGAMPSTTLAVPGGSSAGDMVTDLASAGDVNGDGFADVIIGTGYADSAYVWLGSATGLSAVPSATLTAPMSGARFGRNVAGAGDVNGDGFDDIVVGEGTGSSAYVYLGRSSGIAMVPTTLTAPGGTGADTMGVTGAGDINHDGYADVVIGTTVIMPISSAVYVFLGASAGIATMPSITLPEPNGDTGFGQAVARSDDAVRARGGKTAQRGLRAERRVCGVRGQLRVHDLPSVPPSVLSSGWA